MSEEQKAVSFDEGDVSQSTPQDVEGVEQAADETASEYLTRQEAERLVESVKEDVLRQTQSLTDKTASRIDKKLQDELKKINDVISLQRKAGIEITAEQERNMRQAAYDNVFSQLSESETDHPTGAQHQPKGEQDPSLQATIKLMNRLSDDIYKDVGVTLIEGDPETELVDMSSPEAYLKSLRKAAEKKAQRLETPVEARITSLARGSSISEESLVAELTELQKNPTANKERRKEIMKKLEELHRK